MIALPSRERLSLTSVFPVTATIVVGALLAAGPAAAQTALGDGQRLDANLQRGSGGRNAARPATDFNLRNDLVTGNVAGGIQFRGEVGYTSPRAFRGLAGSDALFEARAYSALGSLPAVLGGWTSDRYSLATDPIILFNRDTTVPSTKWDIGRERKPSPIDARVLIDRASSQGTITRALERSADGLVVGSLSDEDGRPFAVIGSPVTGLRHQPLREGDVRSLDVGLYDWRRFESDLRLRPSPGAGSVTTGTPAGGTGSGLGSSGFGGSTLAGDGLAGSQPERVVPSGLGADLSTTRDASLAAELNNSLSASPSRNEARRELGVGAQAYDDLVRELVDRYANRPDTRVSVTGAELQVALRSELERLSEELGARAPRFDRMFPGVMAADAPGGRTDVPRPPGVGGEPARAPGLASGLAPGPGIGPASGAPTGPAPGLASGLPSDGGATSTVPGQPSPTGAATGDGAATRRPTLEEMAALLRSGGTVRSLSPEQKSQVDELIARGEARLRDGEYFFAEQAFDRALRIAPGHPMATAGLVHSNLGAGLYLSAAVQLRRLFADQPAVVGLKYDSTLLPSKDRLIRNMEAVRLLLTRANIDRSDFGLTLAYVGYQLDDVDAMRQGLDAIQGGDAETALRLLLKKVWLDE